MTPRLKDLIHKEIQPALKSQFGYKNIFMGPKIQKIILNMGLVNLASKEYFDVVNSKILKGQVISPVFKDFKNGKFKIISFFAKKARGMMARHLIETQATTYNDILSFNKEDYQYSNRETTSESSPVFIR